MPPRWRRRPPRRPTAAGRWRCISAIGRTKPRCGRWWRSPPAPRPRTRSPSSRWPRRTGCAPASTASRRSKPAASSCTGRIDRARVPVNRIGIEIEAALAFGTGHHGTTRGCLLALDRIAQGAAPAAKCWTSAPAAACSRSPPPRRCAARCSRATSTPARWRSRATMRGSTAPAASSTVVHAAGLDARRFRARAPFGLVLANILLEPLRRMATPMARLPLPAGGSCSPACSRRRPAPRSRPIVRAASCWNGALRSKAGSTLVLRRPAGGLAVAAASRAHRLPHVRGPIPVVRGSRRRGGKRAAAWRRCAPSLRAAGSPASIVPHADTHQNEYLPAIGGAARLAHRLHRLGRRRRSC